MRSLATEPVIIVFLLSPDPHLEKRNRMQVFGFTVYSKNLSFTHWLNGHFLDVLWN